jgi:hypothetical protein
MRYSIPKTIGHTENQPIEGVISVFLNLVLDLPIWRIPLWAGPFWIR